MRRKPGSTVQCWPIDQWPAGDQTLWQAGFAEAELFGVSGLGVNWSPMSRRKAAQGYGYWLHWLQRQGWLQAEILPAARVTRDRVAQYVRDLTPIYAPYSRAARVQELYDALRLLAPDTDWAWLLQVYQALRSRAHPTRQKRQRLRPVADMIELGQNLMRQAEQTTAWSAQRRAVAYRDGLMITLLVHRPLRLKTFSLMRLDHHLVSRQGTVWLLFTAAETKTRTAYEAVVPVALLPALQRYLTQYRPILLRGEGGRAPTATDAVWVSEVSTQLEAGALSRRIQHRTAAAFGTSIPPHWFRDIATTAIATDLPAHVGDAGLVLGHADHRTTERHYNQAQGLHAARRWQDTLAELRGGAS